MCGITFQKWRNKISGGKYKFQGGVLEYLPLDYYKPEKYLFKSDFFFKTFDRSPSSAIKSTLSTFEYAFRE